MKNLPSDEIMTELTKMAVEQATSLIAFKAREFSRVLPSHVNGRDALKAFADSIDGTNAAMYPKDGSA